MLAFAAPDIATKEVARGVEGGALVADRGVREREQFWRVSSSFFFFWGGGGDEEERKEKPRSTCSPRASVESSLFSHERCCILCRFKKVEKGVSKSLRVMRNEAQAKLVEVM